MPEIIKKKDQECHFWLFGNCKSEENKVIGSLEILKQLWRMRKIGNQINWNKAQ